MKSDAEHEFNAELADLAETPPWEWREDAGDTITKVLRDANAPELDRILAAELGSDIVVINDKLVDVLLSILGNDAEPEEVRGAAATALGPVLEYCDAEFDQPGAEELPISESTFRKIQQTLRGLYANEQLPQLVRRRALEASVRAQEDWHVDAVRAAHASGDDDWKLTAIFCMNFVNGFEKDILESLNSPNHWIRYHAVGAAGNWELAAAWPHIAALLTAPDTDRDLLLAAIEAAPFVNAEEAEELLSKFMDSDDEELSETAHEALELAGGFAHEGDLDEDDLDEDEEPAR